MAFNSYISLIKGKLGAKTPEVAVETLDHSGAASRTKPSADGILLDAVNPHNSGAEAGSDTESARLGDTDTHEHGLIGITTAVEPVELLEDVRGAAPGNAYDLGDTATHEREGGPSPDSAFQVTGDFAESHANLDSSLIGDTATRERGARSNTHSIFTEFTLPTEQLSSEHGGMETTDEGPAFGDSERVLSAQGSGSDEQVVGVTEYGTPMSATPAECSPSRAPRAWTRRRSGWRLLRPRGRTERRRPEVRRTAGLARRGRS